MCRELMSVFHENQITEHTPNEGEQNQTPRGMRTRTEIMRERRGLFLAENLVRVV